MGFFEHHQRRLNMKYIVSKDLLESARHKEFIFRLRELEPRVRIVDVHTDTQTRTYTIETAEGHENLITDVLRDKNGDEWPKDSDWYDINEVLKTCEEAYNND